MPSAVKQTGENLLQCTVKLTGADLVLFNLADVGAPIRPQGFGTQFGPNQSVEAIYVSDHSMPPFATLPASVYGVTPSDGTKYKEGVEAYGLVFVCAETKSPPPMRMPGGVLVTLAVETPRDKALRLLAHELAHVRQAWMLNTNFAAEYERSLPYERSIYEKIAFQVAEEFMKQERAHIRNSAFDRFLPNWVISTK